MIALDFGLGAIEQEFWRVVFLMTRIGAALFAALDALGTQCLMTGTDPMLFDALADRAQRVTVRDGRLNA